jgi:hypothetical protein
MIRTVDLSNWNSPYDLYAFDWPQISGGWEKMKREGLAGGSLVGDVLGLGEDPATNGGGAAAPAPQSCDFTSGALVGQVQASLGVPQTGVFDDETCAAWHEEFGKPPDAASLAALVPGGCTGVVVPLCKVEASTLGRYTPLAIGAGVLVGALLIMGRRR